MLHCSCFVPDFQSLISSHPTEHRFQTGLQHSSITEFINFFPVHSRTVNNSLYSLLFAEVLSPIVNLPTVSFHPVLLPMLYQYITASLSIIMGQGNNMPLVIGDTSPHLYFTCQWRMIYYNSVLNLQCSGCIAAIGERSDDSICRTFYFEGHNERMYHGLRV